MNAALKSFYTNQLLLTEALVKLDTANPSNILFFPVDKCVRFIQCRFYHLDNSLTKVEIMQAAPMCERSKT